MSDVDYYEEVRQKLKIGEGLGTPKHKSVMEFLRMIWNEEEIQLLNNFEKVGETYSVAKIAKKSGMDKNKVREMLNSLADRGTIIKVSNQFGILPLAPGMLELYYLKCGDSKENLVKGAKILREVMNTVLPPMFFLTDTPILRPKLPYDIEERKIIEINQEIKNESQVLPSDLASELVKRNEIFVRLPCQCRVIGEMAGEPCELTHSSENGCLACGVVAETLTNMGIGEKISKEEAIKHIREAEKKGLVHNGANSRGFEAYSLICNCCSCHCAMLSPMKKHQTPGIQKSNYRPKINAEICILCDICVKKCPMEAIYHRYPMKSDNSDEKIVVFDNKCIGCGVCAANCNKSAIIMEKVIKKEAPESMPFDVNIFG
ncbi:MAG: 4Fe-4S dicluster domain-containing protein [Candidatus Lokiarchaeota archaeon]|nr:4Fe-4S dicluster domain-containing protein [Candidatus Lokiarchaeota archaeon]